VDTATLTVVSLINAREQGPRLLLSLEWSGAAASVVEMYRSRAYVEIMGKSEIVPVLITDTIGKILISLL
jgi:aspartyl protease family protein